MEMELLVKAGMPPISAISAATGGNSELFRLTDKLGAIRSGMLADLVVLDGDPLADIRNTRRLRLVMKEGRVVTDRLLSDLQV
jgi:imidazolonepropionase-like amidohydrolase